MFIPRHRKKGIYGEIGRELGDVLRRLAESRESRIEKGHRRSDHVSHDDLDLLGGPSDRVHQGEGHNPYFPEIWQAESGTSWGQHCCAPGYLPLAPIAR